MTIVSVHRSMTRHFTTFPLWYTEWIRDFSTEPWEVALPNTQSLPCYVSWGSNWNKVWKKKWRGHHAPERRSILPWACHSNFWFFIAATRKKRIGKREGKKKKIKEKNPSHFHFSRISLPSHPWWCLFLRFFIQYTFVFFFSRAYRTSLYLGKFAENCLFSNQKLIKHRQRIQLLNTVDKFRWWKSMRSQKRYHWKCYELLSLFTFSNWRNWRFIFDFCSFCDCIAFFHGQ